MPTRALITGIKGQDGSYLAEFLLSMGYEVHGLVRRPRDVDLINPQHLRGNGNGGNLYLHFGDIAEAGRLAQLICDIQPEEVYNLAAQSHVKMSFDTAVYTGDVTGLGAVRLLEAIRANDVEARFYQASSSEMFGASPPPQNEETSFSPRSPYAVAKAYAYWMTVNYRQGYGLFACNGILFNHESPRRPETFVTRKITRALTNILAGNQEFLHLGNLEARRDWGFAPEYVRGIWAILQQGQPDDYVLGTGESHSVREFLAEAFGYVGLDYRDFVRIDPRYQRPLEVDYLLADAAKAQRVLGWQPRVRFRDLVRIMVDADMQALGLTPTGQGQAVLARLGLASTPSPLLEMVPVGVTA